MRIDPRGQPHWAFQGFRPPPLPGRRDARDRLPRTRSGRRQPGFSPSAAWPAGCRRSPSGAGVAHPGHARSFADRRPAPDRIIPLANDNIYANLMLPKLATKYARVTHNEDLNIAQLGNYFAYDFNVLGLDTSGTFTVSLTPVSANVISVGSAHTYTNVTSLQISRDSISFNLDPTVSNGDQVIYIVTCDNGSYTESDTIIQTYGIPPRLLATCGCTTARPKSTPS